MEPSCNAGGRRIIAPMRIVLTECVRFKRPFAVGRQKSKKEFDHNHWRQDLARGATTILRWLFFGGSTGRGEGDNYATNPTDWGSNLGVDAP